FESQSPHGLNSLQPIPCSSGNRKFFCPNTEFVGEIGNFLFGTPAIGADAVSSTVTMSMAITPISSGSLNKRPINSYHNTPIIASQNSKGVRNSPVFGGGRQQPRRQLT